MPKAGIKYGPRIPAPDYAKIGEQAERQVLKELGLERAEDLVTMARPDKLLVKAWDCLQQADAELAAYLSDRNKALAHLWFYEQRIGLAKTAGLQIITYRQVLSQLLYGDKKRPQPANLTNEELVQAAEAAGVERVEGAEEQLLATAPIVYAARMRRDMAVRYMQEAVFALSEEPYGWSPDRIAEHAGVHRDLIYKHRRTARQRHGV
ncbi:hypothetical protein ACIBAC_00790 [Streptomyces sp. NPDC051362]|uniref:hypothetical protein n=1 Tax=Streptomyces sp. NPDC051362 TaxID=3365651 RepID=UPI0037B31C65